VHERYAPEAVRAWRLCPFLRDVETSFGTFFVVMDTETDDALACEAVLAATMHVVHVVYPLLSIEAPRFERFAASVARALKEKAATPPVQATFHPQLSGDRDHPHRLVGLLRRAPDPFLQFIPEGLHQGGTVIAGTEIEPAEDPAESNFERMKGDELARFEAVLADVRADRDRSYARFVDAILTPR